jgi:hypothetical protein
MWEERAGSAQFPPRPYSIDSPESKASERDHCALVKSMKKTFWRQKVKGIPDKVVRADWGYQYIVLVSVARVVEYVYSSFSTHTYTYVYFQTKE